MSDNPYTSHKRRAPDNNGTEPQTIYNKPKDCVLDMQRILLNNQSANPDEVYMMLKAEADDDQILAFDAVLKHWRGLLDDSQRDSIQKSIRCIGGIHITQGPPDTGKTTTALALIELAFTAGRKISVLQTQV